MYFIEDLCRDFWFRDNSIIIHIGIPIDYLWSPVDPISQLGTGAPTSPQWTWGGWGWGAVETWYTCTTGEGTN